MDDRKPKKEPSEPDAPPAAEPEPKHSAMRLPPGAGAPSTRGPSSGRGWGNGGGGRPQTDAARRKGKSRKVH